MDIEFVSSIDSTNSELMRRATKGDYRSVCLVAHRQTAGRGRLGRQWLSDEHSLTFSLGFIYRPKEWSGLSLAVAVSVAQSLHPEIQIKWPNDLWLRGKKLAGILIESTAIHSEQSLMDAVSGDPTSLARYVVIGIGINLQAPLSATSQRQDPLANQTAWRTEPTGLCELLPSITREQTLERVFNALQQDLKHFSKDGWSAYAEKFAQRDALIGQLIELTSNLPAGSAHKLSGQYRGLNHQGAILLQTATGMQTIISHEVSVCLSKK